ncbi:hypothetical protein [Duganella sp. Root1480D1]|uniref:hypothetical protein n=1 Tax=Duganella sp. Root1480D1 TaxID=1736471 RepID=UPI00070AA36B|nr:hypothetical protein [Duganella sp. Root1480D1]KQZ33505.1 hypothetical protein ASD58_29365 [Duganella sp. Root1480D1]
MKVTRKQLLLGGALAATLLAAWFAPSDQAPADAVSTPAPRSARSERPVASPQSPELDVLALRSRDGEDAEQEERALFAPPSWSALPVAVQPGPPAPKAAEAPPPPSLPPLPFKVFGRHQEGKVATVFLFYQEQSLAVKVGETVAEHYKVESIGPTTMQLRYLPLNQLQSLDLGGSL